MCLYSSPGCHSRRFGLYTQITIVNQGKPLKTIGRAITVVTAGRASHKPTLIRVSAGRAVSPHAC